MNCCDLTTVSCWCNRLCQLAGRGIKLVYLTRNEVIEKKPLSMGKTVHLPLIHQQGKQWHAASEDVDVGSTFTLLQISNQKSQDCLLESDFIMGIEVEEGKGGPLLFCAPGHNVFLSLMVTSRPECYPHHSGHGNRG